MTLRSLNLLLFSLFLLAACDRPANPPSSELDERTVDEPTNTLAEEPSLKIKKLKNGHGRAAVAGDNVSVHYTGWLYDESAPDNRGNKFDSSVDRGQTFRFLLGDGQVIKGWDQGVEGMFIGEKRELTIPPDLGYGERGHPPVIPPNATLVFEVELYGAVGPEDAGS